MITLNFAQYRILRTYKNFTIVTASDDSVLVRYL